MKNEQSSDKVRKAREALKSLSAKTPARQSSLYEMIEDLYPDIVEKKALRFSDAEICQELQKAGISIKLGTFAQYVRRIGNERSLSKDKGQPKPPQSAPAPHPADLSSKLSAPSKAKELANVRVDDDDI